MCFIRLAGCSVGCPGCDTNYTKASTATSEEIAEMADATTPKECSDRWVWLTGGEPSDLPQMKQRELLGAIAKKGFRIAVATSGVRPWIPPVDWLSVSPHSAARLAQPYGNEIKLVMGLNDLHPDTFLAANPKVRFMYQYVQPLSVNGEESRESLKECLAWLKHHSDWSLSRQDHHHWEMP